MASLFPVLIEIICNYILFNDQAPGIKQKEKIQLCCLRNFRVLLRGICNSGFKNKSGSRNVSSNDLIFSRTSKAVKTTPIKLTEQQITQIKFLLDKTITNTNINFRNNLNKMKKDSSLTNTLYIPRGFARCAHVYNCFNRYTL